MQLDFYQIGQAGLEQVMLTLLEKTLAVNQKALVLCPMPAASAIDTALWTSDPEHGFRTDLTMQMVLISAKSGCLVI